MDKTIDLTWMSREALLPLSVQTMNQILLSNTCIFFKLTTVQIKQKLPAAAQKAAHLDNMTTRLIIT